MKNGPDLANGFEWTIGDVGPSESEHSPPGGLREVVSSAVAFKGFGQGVPSAAVTLDDQPLIRKSDVDPTVDRCSPRHGHLQDRLCESLHVEEFEHPILEFALRGGTRDRQIAKEFTQGDLSKRFFSRRAAGMNRLEDSILVIVDCSRISRRSQEDLFMNSRDRLEQGEFLRSIESELESILKNNQLLRELGERRKHEDVASKLQDSKPFKEVLEHIIRKSPSLANFLGGKGPLSDPFRSRNIKAGNGFIGKTHPSRFRFRNMDYGHELERTTAINMRSRVMFETDVVNDYFTRSQYAGEYLLRLEDQPTLDSLIPDHTLNLQNGVATLNLALPNGAKVGDRFGYELIVQDETLVEPFANRFAISVGPYQKVKPSPPVPPNPHPNVEGDDDGKAPQGLAIPTPIPIYEAEWEEHKFDKFSALKAIYDPPDDEALSGSHTYYINMDNIHLNTELKATKVNPEMLKARWQYGMVLIGMALLKDDKAPGVFDGNGQESEGDEKESPEDIVYKATAAIAPVLLPLIEHLGALSDDDITP